ncbi:MAG: ASPIC/UnbV domain-containing protein [Planctomycetota bacterium]
MATSRSFRGSWSGYERDRLFVRPGGTGARFAEAGYVLGLDFEHDGRVVVPVDLDGDGDLDLLLHALQGLRAIENTLPPKRFVRVELRSPRGPAATLGARVEVSAGGRTQTDWVRITGGFQAQIPTQLHFGLGDAEAVERLLIQWPSGRTDVLEGLPTQKRLVIHEPREPEETARVEALALAHWPETTRPPIVARNLTGLSARRLNDAEARDPASADSLPLHTRERATVINVWAPWCAPCKRELPALARLARACKDKVRFLGLSAEVNDLDSVRAAVTGADLPYEQGLLDDEIVERLFGRAGEVPLPATFVFDADGKLRRAYFRETGEQELQSLLASLDDEPVIAADLALKGVIAMESKRCKEALTWFDRAVKADDSVARYHNNRGVALGCLGRHGEAAEAFQRSARLAPEAADTWFNLGAALLQDGSPAKAKLALRTADRLRPGQPPILLLLARAASSAGDPAGARAAYQAVLKIDPNHPGAVQGLERLNETSPR